MRHKSLDLSLQTDINTLHLEDHPQFHRLTLLIVAFKTSLMYLPKS